MIVHVQTVIETTFGLLDGDHNVIAQDPIVARVVRFSPDGFAEAHAMITEQRDKAKAVYEQENHAAD